jgi:hypothetical protein
MSDNLDWKKAENIAALIEKTISPDAHVQTNVQLPVLGTSRTRQCDVAIYFGNPPRQTIAIVEVQKRKRKPDITTFHGWLRKMQEVGAQQLFCVSALGYPKSIIDDVQSRIGPTVKLLTMEDLDSGDRTSPFTLAQFILDTSPKYQITDIGTPKVASARDTSLCLNTGDRIISIGSGNERFSLDELLSTALNNFPNLPQPAPHEIEGWVQLITLPLESFFESTWLHLDNESIQVIEWTVGLRLLVEAKTIPIPVTNLEYKQEALDGAIAWVAHTQFNHKGQSLELTVVVMPDEQGFLRNVRTWLTAA